MTMLPKKLAFLATPESENSFVAEKIWKIFMKRKLFLLTITLFSFLGNLQAQDVENAIASSQTEINLLETGEADSEKEEEAPRAEKQKNPGETEEGPAKRPRGSSQAS